MKALILTVMAVTLPMASGQTPPEPVPPFIEAVWNRDIDRVKELLAEGADPDGKGATEDGMPPWYWAISNGEYRAAELMLERVRNSVMPQVWAVKFYR